VALPTVAVGAVGVQQLGMLPPFVAAVGAHQAVGMAPPPPPPVPGV
jgi:hypothetical protein